MKMATVEQSNSGSRLLRQHEDAVKQTRTGLMHLKIKQNHLFIEPQTSESQQHGTLSKNSSISVLY